MRFFLVQWVGDVVIGSSCESATVDLATSSITTPPFEVSDIMGRSILAGILGYVCMVLVVMLGALVQWLILGPVGAFEPDSTIASTNWAVAACISGLIASIVGGVVAARIDRVAPQRGVRILIGIVLVLGILTAVGTMFGEPKKLPAGKELADMEFVEAGQYATSPVWFNWLIPFIGATGAWAGACLIKAKPGSQAPGSTEPSSPSTENGNPYRP